MVDGYVDEPTCLGVPPYVSMYPRYIAGAIWAHSPHTEVLYQTIDQIRQSFEAAWRIWSTSDLIVLIAGMIVPGKYIGGTPISVREARELFSHPMIDGIPKMLVGPWARFGCGLEGGRRSVSPDSMSPPFDYVVSGDPEIVIAEAIQAGDVDAVPVDLQRSSMDQIEEYAIRGAQIVSQHPNYSRGYLICEIETYRGCPRFITGGCSFCVEPSYGPPAMRTVESIVREIGALYDAGVRAFRLGRQADMFTYGSPEVGEEEFPRPAPDTVEELFSKIRRVCPDIRTLHIDNVNPGTVVHNPEESREVARAIMRYHTTGDVAAFGVESADPVVIRRNNLKVTAEEAIEAVRIINEIGRVSPPNELPHLLPGINLLYGLPGESRRTLEYNMAFLESLIEEDLLVRRINIRQVIGFEGTRLGRKTHSRIKHHQFFQHKKMVREKVDLYMLKRVAPPGTVIRSAFVEHQDGNSLLMRPLASYPLLCHVPIGKVIPEVCDLFVVDHGPRSVSALPYPFRTSEATLNQWRRVPGIGARRAARLKMGGPWRSRADLEGELGFSLPDWFAQCIKFED